MSNKTKRNILNLIFYAAIIVAALAMIVAYRRFGFRAALLAFAAECAAIAMSMSVYLQDEFIDDDEEPEQYETHQLKCGSCGETFEYRGAALQISDLNRRGRPIGRLEIPCGDFNLAAANLHEEKKQEFQRLRRCPICGGELVEIKQEGASQNG